MTGLFLMLTAVLGWVAFLERDDLSPLVRMAATRFMVDLTDYGRHTFGRAEALSIQDLIIKLNHGAGSGANDKWAEVLHNLNVNGDYARLARA